MTDRVVCRRTGRFIWSWQEPISDRDPPDGQRCAAAVLSRSYDQWPGQSCSPIPPAPQNIQDSWQRLHQTQRQQATNRRHWAGPWTVHQTATVHEIAGCHSVCGSGRAQRRPRHPRPALQAAGSHMEQPSRQRVTGARHSEPRCRAHGQRHEPGRRGCVHAHACCAPTAHAHRNVGHNLSNES